MWRTLKLCAQPTLSLNFCNLPPNLRMPFSASTFNLTNSSSAKYLPLSHLWLKPDSGTLVALKRCFQVDFAKISFPVSLLFSELELLLHLETGVCSLIALCATVHNLFLIAGLSNEMRWHD